MPTTDSKTHTIAEWEIEDMLSYVRENGPCKAADVARHVKRAQETVRRVMARDDRFFMWKDDVGHLFINAHPHHDGTTITLWGHGWGVPDRVIAYHAMVRKGTHKAAPGACLFAIIPSLITDDVDDREYGLKSIRYYAEEI